MDETPKRGAQAIAMLQLILVAGTVAATSLESGATEEGTPSLRFASRRAQLYLRTRDPSCAMIANSPTTTVSIRKSTATSTDTKAIRPTSQRSAVKK